MTDDTTPAALSAGDPTDEAVDALLDGLPPASQDQGAAGHDLARAAARRAQAIRLRTAGATYQQIADQCGYTDKGTARNVVIRALRAVEAESVTEYRLLENARLDQDEVVLRTLIADSEKAPAIRIRAIDSRVRLSARRARLNGLDAPIQVALSAGVAADLEDALAEAEAVFIRGEVLDSRDEPYDEDRLEG